MKKITFALVLLSTSIHAVKLMTYNAPVGAVENGLSQHEQYELRWTAREPGILALLEAQDPTVFGLQEPQDYQTNRIGNKLRKKYDYYGKPNKEFTLFGIKALSWPPLIFDNNVEFAPLYWHKELELLDKGTFWLSGKQWKAQAGTDVVRICSWVKLRDAMQRIFYVYNTHLDQHTDEIRCAGMQAILNAMPQDSQNPIFLMGDFNAALVGALATLVTQAGFVNTRDLATHPSAPGTTYTGWQGTESGSIDHILVKNPQHITVTGHQIIQPAKKLSDHYPVVVDLDWNT